MWVFSLFLGVFGGTRDVYGASRMMESLSGSLSMSSMRHVLGIGLLGSFGGDMGEWGRSLSFLGGGGGCECVEVCWMWMGVCGLRRCFGRR